jgi:hypothetical protein
MVSGDKSDRDLALAVAEYAGDALTQASGHDVDAARVVSQLPRPAEQDYPK